MADAGVAGAGRALLAPAGALRWAPPRLMRRVSALAARCAPRALRAGAAVRTVRAAGGCCPRRNRSPADCRARARPPQPPSSPDSPLGGLNSSPCGSPRPGAGVACGASRRAAAASVALPLPGDDAAGAPRAAPPPPLYPRLAPVLDFVPALRWRDALAAALAFVAAAALAWALRSATALGRAAPPAAAAVAAVALGAAAAALTAAVAREAQAQAVLLPSEEAADADSRFADAAGVRVHYKLRRARDAAAGAGAAARPARLLACCHGMGANEASFTLRGALDALAQRCAAVALAHDAVGFGLTARPADVAAYGLARGAAVANALVAAVAAAEGGAPQRVLIGHSLGGLLAVRAAEAAAQAGAPYAALILVAPAVFAPLGAAPADAAADADAAAAAAAAAGAQPRALRALRAVALALAQLLLGALAAAASPLALAALRSAVRSVPFWRGGLRQAYVAKAQVDAALIDAYRRPAAVRGWDDGMLRFVASRLLPGGPAAILAAAAAAAAREPPPQQPRASAALAALARAGTPVLILHGDGDALVPLRNSVALAARTPGARLVVLRGVGHSPQEEAPAAFVEAVGSFLDEALGAPAAQ
jgi:pimeloyl-ACP methyl ester carboxylesterase